MRKSLPISLYILLTLGPLILGFGYSLLYSFGWAGLLGKGFTTGHWSKLFSDGGIWISLSFTLLLVLLSLLFSIIPALVFTWRFTLVPKAQGLYNWLFIPLTFPPLIAGFAIYHLVSPSGLLSRIATQTGLSDGIESFPRMVNDYWAIGIILAHIFLVFPFFTIVLTNISRKERIQELFQTATTLGARPIDFARKVFLPLILRKAAPVLMLYGIFLFGTYEVPLLLGRSNPQVITVFISDKISKFDLSNIPQGHAAAVLYILLTAITVTVFLSIHAKQTRHL